MDNNEIKNELTAEQVKFIDAVVKAERFWKASETEVATFEAAGGPAIVAAAGTQEFKAHLDKDRYYLARTGPAVKDPALRELVVVLHETMKAHAIAYLIGVPPKYVGGLRAAGLKARTETVAKKVAA